MKLISIVGGFSVNKSHPTRVRGLKLLNVIVNTKAIHMSHPTRVRGLKRQIQAKIPPLPSVAPHTGAWIETPKVGESIMSWISRTPHGCVD